jgi:P27 family predicted phage terminase small subunit
LAKLGTLATTDTHALEAAAETMAEAREARAAIEKEGRFYTSPTRDGGTMIRPHPALASMQDADKRLRAWLIEFGLTPASRGKVSTNTPADTAASDPLARYVQ